MRRKYSLKKMMIHRNIGLERTILDSESNEIIETKFKRVHQHLLIIINLIPLDWYVS